MPAKFEEESEPDQPSLAAEDQKLVDDWWEEVWPIYSGKGRDKKSGWLLERTVAFLDQQPRLFSHLYLHDEFLFELAGGLAHVGRMDDYLALLRRLRREEPVTYLECFGYYDYDLIADALRTGRRHEIPAYLNLFQQHPLKHTEQRMELVDLLAWHGCETELRELLEPTAQIIADSPEVLCGDFGLRWLTYLAMFPFLAAGDDSKRALDELCQATEAIGYLEIGAPKNRTWLHRAVQLASRSPTEAGVDFKKSKDGCLENDVSWSFTGWVQRSKGLSWTSARFLSDTLLSYWDWRDQKEKPIGGPFGLNETRLDGYLTRRSYDICWFKGVTVFSTLQAFHYFTDYLVLHAQLSPAEADRLQSATSGMFELIRGAMDITDPVYRLYPAYAVLIGGPEARRSPDSRPA